MPPTSIPCAHPVQDAFCVPTLTQIDAFTHTAFGGNSGAVVLLEPQHLPMTDAARQAIAMEMNLSETAFVEATPTEDDGEIGEGMFPCTPRRPALPSPPVCCLPFTGRSQRA